MTREGVALCQMNRADGMKSGIVGPRGGIARQPFGKQQIGCAQFRIGRGKQRIALERHRRTASRAIVMASG